MDARRDNSLGADESSLTIINSTFSNNSSGNRGGGFITNVNVTLVSSTVTENTSERAGGVFFFNNNNTSVTYQNSIVAGNFSADSDPNDNAPARLSGSNILDGDPLLGPLADNGGPTQTHAILPGSPAINAGSNALAIAIPLATDQRGNRRIEAGAIDIGAFESSFVTEISPPTVASTTRDEGGVLARPDLMETFTVTFDTDVSVNADHLVVRNETTGSVIDAPFGAGFSYDDSTFTATWDFSVAFLSDQFFDPAFYSFQLSDEIASVSSGLNLDGDADRIPGGDFIVPIYVALPGDANLDGQVDVLGDAFALVGNLGTTDGASWAQGDFNGDGTVDVLNDAFILVGQLGQSVVPPMASAASSNRMTDTPRQLTAEPEKPTLMPVDESVSLVILQEGERQPTLPSSSAVKLALAGSQAIDDAFAADSLLDDGLF